MPTRRELLQSRISELCAPQRELTPDEHQELEDVLVALLRLDLDVRDTFGERATTCTPSS